VRGRGLLQALELVTDRSSKDTFDPRLKLHARVRHEAMARGLMVYPMGGTADGERGDHVLLAPPFIADGAAVDTIVDAPMPHSIFFTKIGHAIHGSYDTKKLGMPASHGCVRISPAHAATLFALVKQDGLVKTKVVLTGSEQVALAQRGVRVPRSL
jgi:4-aminobutyrate aminotransferase-like enzyme